MAILIDCFCCFAVVLIIGESVPPAFFAICTLIQTQLFKQWIDPTFSERINPLRFSSIEHSSFDVMKSILLRCLILKESELILLIVSQLQMNKALKQQNLNNKLPASLEN